MSITLQGRSVSASPGTTIHWIMAEPVEPYLRLRCNGCGVEVSQKLADYETFRGQMRFPAGWTLIGTKGGWQRVACPDCQEQVAPYLTAGGGNPMEGVAAGSPASQHPNEEGRRASNASAL